MTTYTKFLPTTRGPFKFPLTLDGNSYTITVTWNISRLDWYVNITDQGNNLIVSRAMVGSPPGYDISLTGGYFASTLVFREASQQFEVSP